MIKIKGIFLLFFYALILAKTLYIIIIQKERQVDMKEIKIDNIYVATDNMIEMYSDGYTNSESICILEKTDNNIEHKHILLTIYIDIKSNKYLYISKDGVVLPRKENIIYTIENIKSLKQILKEFNEKSLMYGSLFKELNHIYEYVITKLKEINKNSINLVELKEIINHIEILYIVSLTNIEIEFDYEESPEEKRSNFYLVKTDKNN